MTDTTMLFSAEEIGRLIAGLATFLERQCSSLCLDSEEDRGTLAGKLAAWLATDKTILVVREWVVRSDNISKPKEPRRLDLLEQLLKATESVRELLQPEDRKVWQHVAAQTGVLQQAIHAPGEFYFEGENRDRVYCDLTPTAALHVHKSDEGVVLDVWDRDVPECNGPIWSTYHFDSEMLRDAANQPRRVKFVLKQVIQETVTAVLEEGQSPEQMLALMLEDGDYQPDETENLGEAECWIEDANRNLIPIEPEGD